MHENLAITDGVYGILSDNDVRYEIADLGQKIGSRNVGNVEELIRLTKALLERLGQSYDTKLLE